MADDDDDNDVEEARVGGLFQDLTQKAQDLADRARNMTYDDLAQHAKDFAKEAQGLVKEVATVGTSVLKRTASYGYDTVKGAVDAFNSPEAQSLFQDLKQQAQDLAKRAQDIPYGNLAKHAQEFTREAQDLAKGVAITGATLLKRSASYGYNTVKDGIGALKTMTSDVSQPAPVRSTSQRRHPKKKSSAKTSGATKKRRSSKAKRKHTTKGKLKRTDLGRRRPSSKRKPLDNAVVEVLREQAEVSRRRPTTKAAKGRKSTTGRKKTSGRAKRRR